LLIILFSGEFWLPEYGDSFDKQLIDDFNESRTKGKSWIISDKEKDRE